MHPEAPNFRALAAPFAAVPLPEVNVASSAVQSAAPYVPPVRFAARLALVRLHSAPFAAVPLAVVEVALSAVLLAATGVSPVRFVARLALAGLAAAEWAALEVLCTSWGAGSPCVRR